MEKIVQKLIGDLSLEEVEKIKTTTGMVVLIVKIIEKVHKKKNLSYEDSKRLVSLVIDMLIIAFRDRNISRELDQLIFDVEKNKETIKLLVSEFIDVWHGFSDLCNCDCGGCKGCTCKGKKSPRIRKSIVPYGETVRVTRF